jgi:PIN like domain
MRDFFRHYFKPTEAALRHAWQHCLFSFDASVLLNIYAYSHETREKLVNFTEQNDDRVRLPHQFALEYSRNRASVIAKQVSKYAKVEEALRNIALNYFAPNSDHPYLSKKSSRALKTIQTELAESRKTIEKWIGVDPHAERIFKAFENRMGSPPTQEELHNLHIEAEERYKQLIPPGFADLKEKKAPEAYGDYIGWHQLIAIAKAEQKSMILVNDDLKDDWWYTVGDRQIGPRPELLEEFSRETKQELYMYTSENFLRAAKKFMSADIRDELIEEVRKLLEGQRETQRAADLKPTSIQSRVKPFGTAVDAGSAVKSSESKLGNTPGPQDKPETIAPKNYAKGKRRPDGG